MTNKYKKMFLDGKHDSLDDIVSNLSIMNAYSLSVSGGDDNTYFKKDGKEIIEFTNWFFENYDSNKLRKKFARNWGGMPRILNIGIYLREQKELQELSKISKNLTSIQKENVNILFDYIWKKRCIRTLCFTFWDDEDKPCFVNFTLDKYIPKVKLDGFKGFVKGYIAKGILESGSLVLNCTDDLENVSVLGFDMFPKTIKDISLTEMQKIIDKDPDKSIKAIGKLSNLEFKVDREVSKVEKNLILNTFKEDLDDKNFESFIDKFDEIEDIIIPFIDDLDFENDYKDALISFGDWFVKTYGKRKDLIDFINETYITSKPMSLIIYDSLKTKSSNTLYNTYVKMFSERLDEDENIDSIISSLAYVNSYFVRNTNEDEKEADIFKENNKDSIIIFYHWFMTWFGDDETKKLIKENWYGDPQVFVYAKSFMDLDEELDEYFEFLDETFDSLSFSDKKNLETILTYILNVPGEKSISFSSPDGTIEDAIPVPDKIDATNDEEIDAFEFLKKLLKGKLSLMLSAGGTVIIFRYPDEKNAFVSAISKTPLGIECVDPEIIQSDLYFSLEKKVNVEYETADLVFI